MWTILIGDPKEDCDLGNIYKKLLVALQTPHVRMLKFVVLTICLGYAYSCGEPAVPPNIARVVNWQDAVPHSFPWQVSVQYQDTSGDWRHACGGSLITEQWVLTAAHCIDLSRVYRVYLGKHSLATHDEEGSIVLSIDKIIIHENSDSLVNDIALIKLSERVPLSDSIQPACLPANEHILPHNYSCYVTGWGRLNSNGPINDHLQQAHLRVLDHNTCSKSNWWASNVSPLMICAGGDGIGCNGDSGGLLNCPISGKVWELNGIVSRGVECEINKPTAFTNFSPYIGWISQQIANN